MEQNRKILTEQYLDQLSQAKEKLDEYRWQLKKASAKAYSLVSPCLSDSKVQFSLPSDAAFVRKLEKKEDLNQLLSARIQPLQALIDQAAGLIDQYTSGRENTILKLRYLKGRKWLEISEVLDHLSPKQLRRIGRKGMEKIILPEDAIWINRQVRKEIPA